MFLLLYLQVKVGSDGGKTGFFCSYQQHSTFAVVQPAFIFVQIRGRKGLNLFLDYRYKIAAVLL